MISMGKSCLWCLLPLWMSAAAPAQDIGFWTLGSFRDPGGGEIHIASLRSSTMISSGISGGDYAPAYAISCRTDDPRSWRQQLQLEDAVSGGGKVELLAKVDAKPWREEIWTNEPAARKLTRLNVPDITELKSAQKLVLKWSWGWTWLWITDKASFDLGESRVVIFTLAKNCGIPEP